MSNAQGGAFAGTGSCSRRLGHVRENGQPRVAPVPRCRELRSRGGCRHAGSDRRSHPAPVPVRQRRPSAWSCASRRERSAVGHGAPPRRSARRPHVRRPGPRSGSRGSARRLAPRRAVRRARWSPTRSERETRACSRAARPRPAGGGHRRRPPAAPATTESAPARSTRRNANRCRMWPDATRSDSARIAPATTFA